MSKQTRQPRAANAFNECVHGSFGAFGTGSGLRICYVQAAFRSVELARVSLVHEIDGSDRWPVRDLFQREVDFQRVREAIVPWLMDETKVKFFNPLTLTLIPVETKTGAVRRTIPSLKKTKLKERSTREMWGALTADGLFRFRWLEKADAPDYDTGVVEWNRSDVRLVAIDGQHRLTALRMYLASDQGKRSSKQESWRVPVVISAVQLMDGDGTQKTIHDTLDVVRSMFVYINTQARAPSKTRQILLNDDEINHICTQELLQFSHENDVNSDAKRNDPARPPLTFFDWRGETKGGREIKSPVALISVAEISNWMENYILAQQFEEDQALGLGVTKKSDPLDTVFRRKQLTPGTHPAIRDRFRKFLLPGLVHLLENFRPYREYISRVRDMESRATASAEGRLALSLLRFGSHGERSPNVEIRRAYDKLVEDLMDAKSVVPMLVAHDIGMRGVIYAFGTLRSWFNTWHGLAADSPWLEFSRWYTKHLNEVESKDWFGGKGQEYRKHISASPSGDVVNFRLQHIERGFGAFVTILVCAYGAAAGEVPESGFEEVWDTFAKGEKSLFTTLKSGYRKQILTGIKEDHPSWPASRQKEQAEAQANQAAWNHLKRFRRALPS